MNFRASASGVNRRAAAVVDLTALIDVVFLLLIFFVLTSSMVDQQASSDVARVEVNIAETSLAADNREYDDLRVAVDEAGSVFVDGEQVTTTELQPRFCRAYNENPETLVLIEADQAVPHGRVAQVLAAAHTCQLKVHMAEGAGN